MKLRIALCLAIVSLGLGGCATPPQTPIPLAATAVGSGGGRVGVVMTPLPKPDVLIRGADCLLCIAAASLATASLSGHAQTLPPEDLPKLKDEVARRLRAKGGEVVVIDKDLDVEKLPDVNNPGPNVARKDFSSLLRGYSVERLVVIEIQALGFLRTYASYFPTSDPRGYLQGRGYMVNLKNNTYDWYLPVSVIRAADGKWDEPPKFPGLTNAYYQALELGKDSFLTPLGK